MELMLLTYTCGDVGQMPIGPLVLAQLARQRGWSVQIKDLPPESGEEALIQQLAQCQMVGLSTVSNTFHRSIRIAETIKSRHPHITVVMGGPQATATAEYLMKHCQAVDMVFMGEAEESWEAFLDGHPRHTLSGVAFRQNGQIVKTNITQLYSDLNQSPMPAFDLYPPSRSGLSVPIETGRGCPFLCTYCSTNRFFSRRFRAKSPARILQEMDTLFELYGMTSFDLIQDNFNTDPKTIIAFCDAILAHHRRYTWNISARPDKVDETLATRLKYAGCEGIYFGVETGSQHMQRVVRKNLRLQKAVHNILNANQMGFLTTVSFIVGFPGENEDYLRETLLLYTQLAALPNNLAQLHLLSPLQGSQLMMVDRVPLAFDGMPTDFNENDDGWSDWDLVMFRNHPQLFPHMHHYQGTAVARSRYLFIVYLVRLALTYFHNFFMLACRHQKEEWVNFLLDTPIPDGMVDDHHFPLPPAKWIELAASLFDQFAQRMTADGHPWQEMLQFDHAHASVSHIPGTPATTVYLPRMLIGKRIHRFLPAAANEWLEPVPFLVAKNQRNLVTVTYMLEDDELLARIEEICSPCGECCLDEQGFHCSYEEWRAIASFMKAHQQTMPPSQPVAWQGMTTVGRTQFVVQTEGGYSTFHETEEEAKANAGEEGWVRTACCHLRADHKGMRCSIEKTKPLECIAFPFTLVASPQTDNDWHLEEGKMFYALREKCPLTRALKKDPPLHHAYHRYVTRHLVAHADNSQKWRRSTEDSTCLA